MKPYLKLLLLLPLLLCGCGPREDTPFLGRWDGQFTVTRLTAPTQIKSVGRNLWRGFLLLYRTSDGAQGNRCTCHLENEQEAVDLKGHWLVRRNQIEVRFNDVKIDDAGGADGRDPNKAYLQPNEIHQRFNLPLILTAKRRLTMLESPLLQFGPLLGKFAFSKSSLPH